MRVTNHENLPTPIVSAITRDYKSTQDKYSVTTIEKGVREILLSRRHETDLEMDASDGIWALLGQLMHGIMEQAKEEDNQLKEEYLTIEMPYYENLGFLPYGSAAPADLKPSRVLCLSGKFDLYDGLQKELTDYKLTSVWSYVYGGKIEWKQQLAGYALIMNKLGFPVDKAQNVVIYRDWSKGKARGGGADYPKRAVQVIKYSFIEKDFEDIYNLIVAKFGEILKYESTPDDELPVCTEAERWAKQTTYAVMKKGRQSALRVLFSMEDATVYMSQKGGDEVVVRPGESTKCMDYCNCCKFCNFWKEHCQEENVPSQSPVE